LRSSELLFPRLRLPIAKYVRAHHISRASLIVAGVLAATVFFFVGAGLRLLIGPISLGPFSGKLSDAIAQAIPGVTVKYDQAAVEWSRDEGRVTLVILGARVFDEDGRIIAQAPKADIALAAGAFVEGKVEVKRITLVGVQLTLVRTRDGAVRLGVGKGSGRNDFLSNITDAITATSSKTSSLQTFAVRDARIAVYDEVTGLFVVAPRANMMIATAGPNLSASFDADIEISGRPAKVRASIILPPKSGPVRGDVEFIGLDLGALGANAKPFALVKGIALSVDMSASFVIDHGAHLASADFGANAYGAVGMPGLIVGPVNVKSARIIGRYDGATGRLLIDDALLQADRATAHLIGAAYFGYDANHALSHVGFETTADSIRLDMPQTLERPVSFSRLAARGDYHVATNVVDIAHVGVQSQSLSLDASGTLTLVAGQSPAIGLNGTVGALSVKDLLRYWPMTVGGGARDWVSKNVPSGSVGPLILQTQIPAGALDQGQLPDNALSLTFPITNAEANYVQGLTHLTAVAGTGMLSGDTFAADFPSAKIGSLQVSQGHVVIPSLHTPGTVAAIRAHIEGAVPNILALIDEQPLNYPGKFGIDPSDTKGSTVVDLSVDVPTKKDVSVDQVKIAVKAVTTGFEIALGTRARLTSGAIQFTVDNDHLRANGSGQVAGSPVALDWNEDFRPGDGITTRISAKGTLDDKARAALEFDTSAFLKGPVGVDATLTGRHGHFDHADVSMDLSPAILAVDLAGIQKSASEPANATASLVFGAHSVLRRADVRLSSPAGTILGTENMDAAGSLQSLIFPSVHYGPTNDFSFSLTKSASGTEIAVHGHSLDGSKLAHIGSTAERTASSGQASNTEHPSPFHMSVKLDKLALRDNVAVEQLALDVTGVGDELSALSLSGSMGRNGTLSGSLTNGVSGSRRIVLQTSDAGQLARGFFGLTGMRGGRLELTANLPNPDRPGKDQPDFQGNAILRDATLVNQPFLARLFDVASFAGIQNLLQGQGISIDKIEVPFSSKNSVISIHDATASGPTIGATADGYIDRPQNAVAIKGSLVPVVGVNFNKILGAIPLVGNILVSKKGEGIFGVTYSAKGNADQPNITVNPLSMLTPGILRRVFEGRMPNASQAPSNLARPPARSTLPTATQGKPGQKP